MPQNDVQRLKKKLRALRDKPEKGTLGRKKVDLLIELAIMIYHSNPKEAEKYARRAHSIAVQLDYDKGIARSNHIRGNCYIVRSQYRQATDYYLKALKAYENSGNARGTANVLMNIGNVCDGQSDYERALEHLLRALSIFEEISDKTGIMGCCSNIGNIYTKLNDLDHGLEYYYKSRKISTELGHKRGIAASCSNIGIIQARRGNCNLALKYKSKALRIFNEIGDKIGLAESLSDIGTLYADKGSYKKALNYQLKALGILEERGNKNVIATSYGSIGVAYMKLRDYDTALKYLRRALKATRKLGTKNEEMETYRHLSELFVTQAEYEQALKYYRKYTELDKAIFNTKKSKQITEMRTKYETEKKEKEAEIYQLKNVALRKEIRQRKKAEKELKKHRDALEQLVAERTAQLRSLAHELSLVEEKQRREIATYLHDEINQAMALATFKLESLQESSSTQNVRGELNEIKEILDQTAQRIRSLTFEISPPILYELGLTPAVEWLLEQFGEQYNITCKFKDDGLHKPMTDDARILLFQSVRELLNNISKHANARRVTVSSLRDGNLLRIAVEDDGVGFDPKLLDHKVSKNEGFGLFNLKERLRHVRGQLKVKSEKGKGTSVVLIAPLRHTRRSTRAQK